MLTNKKRYYYHLIMVMSVGVKLTITPEIKTEIIQQIKKHKPSEMNPNFSVDDISDTIYSGIYYSMICKGGHHKSTIKNDDELYNWYRKQKPTNKIYIKSIFVKNHVICGSATYDGKPLFVVLYNTGSTTTLHKKNCVNGRYGSSITLDSTLAIDVVPYID